MDMTWITDRIAVGGGIWNDANMIEVVRTGITHILDMQIEFDDTPLAQPYDVTVLWNPTDDDFQHKPAEIFERGVVFALGALAADEKNKVYIHCAAGVHRAPMMTLALLGRMGWPLKKAMKTIQQKRYVVDWADVYVKSVEEYVRNREVAVQGTE